MRAPNCATGPLKTCLTLNANARAGTRQPSRGLRARPVTRPETSDGSGQGRASGSAGLPLPQESHRKTASGLSASRPDAEVAPAICCQPASLQSDRRGRRYRVGSDERSQKVAVLCEDGSADLTRTLRAVKRSGARRPRPQAGQSESSGNSSEEKSSLSASPQVLHDSCTGFPQERRK